MCWQGFEFFSFSVFSPSFPSFNAFFFPPALLDWVIRLASPPSFIGNLLLNLALLLFPFAYYCRKNLRREKILSNLDLRPMGPVRLLAHSLILFVIGILSANLFAAVFCAADDCDLDRIAQKAKSQHPLSILMAASFGPFAEEVFFRGFLRKKIGNIASSALFGMAHYAYGSWMLFAAATAYGLILCGYADEEGNILPGFVAHLAYNIAALKMMLG
jgi:membrane protease YdiL (CAAX protease family)